MTIFELIAIYEGRIAKLSGYLRTVHANRLPNDSAVARRVRRRLLTALDEMIDHQREQLASEQRYLKRTTEAERTRDDEVDPDFYEDDFVEIWDGNSLLDSTAVHSDGRHAFDPYRCRWCEIDGPFPLFVPVTDDELGALASILHWIEDDLGITFAIERIFFDEASAVEFLALAPIGVEGIARLAGEPPS